jgi:adenosyl cobinamide kinase/adenosyl cobinamide phosphate guanylyltransferase
VEKMADITLVTGGAKSGKSRMALSLAADAKSRIFVATAEARDEEMEERIAWHRQERGEGWITVEEPLDLELVLRNYPAGILVLDCLTLWLANALERGISPKDIDERSTLWIEAAKRRSSTTIIVTNEAGMGVVPITELGRLFRDLCGSLNQRVASEANRVIFMVSGLPLYLK